MGEEMKPTIVCRCNDVTLEDVVSALKQGLDDFELLRKYLRIGFGPCQGRGCLSIAARIFSRFTGKPVSEALANYVVRPPVLPVNIAVLLRGVEE